LEYLTLPFDLSLLDLPDITSIPVDMSQLQFPCNDDVKIRATFIFLRNIDLDLNLDFSKCSYEDKEKFILMFMTGDISSMNKEMIDTWIDILLSKYLDNDITGILNSSEIDLFKIRNIELINNIYNLIASLTVLGIYKYIKSGATGSDMIEFDEEFENTDYDEINFKNFSRLTISKYFGIIFQNVDTSNMKFYSKYFDGEDQISIARINKNLPVINLLNIFFAPEDVQNDFVDKINNLLIQEEEVDIDE